MVKAGRMNLLEARMELKRHVGALKCLSGALHSEGVYEGSDVFPDIRDPVRPVKVFEDKNIERLEPRPNPRGKDTWWGLHSWRNCGACRSWGFEHSEASSGTQKRNPTVQGRKCSVDTSAITDAKRREQASLALPGSSFECQLPSPLSPLKAASLGSTSVRSVGWAWCLLLMGLVFFSYSRCFLVGVKTALRISSCGLCHLGLGTGEGEAGCEVMCQKGSLLFRGTPFQPKCPSSWAPKAAPQQSQWWLPGPALCTWRAAPVGGSTWGPVFSPSCLLL